MPRFSLSSAAYYSRRSPCPDPDLVAIAGNAYPGAGVHEPIGSAVPDCFDRLRDVTAFDAQALFRR